MPNVSWVKDINEVKYGRKVKRIATFEVTQKHIDNNLNILLNNCSNIKNIYVNGVLIEPDENNQIAVTEVGTYEVEMEFESNEINDDLFCPGNFIENDNTFLFMPSGVNPSLIKLNNDFFVGLKNLPALMGTSIENINITDSVIRFVGAQQFAYCQNLIQIIIPNSVTFIGMQALANTCPKLKVIIYGNNIDNTGGYYAVGTCPNLETIILGENIKTITNGSFYQCTSLRKIEIPKYVSLIQTDAFTECSNLSEITSYAITAPTLEVRVFNNNAASGVLKVPTGSDYSTWLTQLGTGWTIEYI